MIGTVVDEVLIDVERGKIREFVRATAVEDPVHTDIEAAVAAGFDAEPATATHVVVAGHHRDQAAVVAALGLDIQRIVVGSVSWRYLRPLTAGDRLRGIRRLVADESRTGRRGGAMRMVTLETEYLDAAGSPVVRQTEVLVERGAAPAEEAS